MTSDDIPPPTPGAALEAWLDGCEARLVHPALVADALRHRGWDRYRAAAVAEDYRRRFNEHPLGYAALLVSTGVVALTAGGTGHTLTAGIDGPVDRYQLAIWLSVLVCVLPFAVWAHWWADRVDREDVVAVWSRPRRQLAILLLWGCGIVGGLRLVVYAVELIGYLVGAPWLAAGSLTQGTLNLAIVAGIAGPLAWWAYRFLHRFDGEDPTVPPAQRRRPARPPRPARPAGGAGGEGAGGSRPDGDAEWRDNAPKGIDVVGPHRLGTPAPIATGRPAGRAAGRPAGRAAGRSVRAGRR